MSAPNKLAHLPDAAAACRQLVASGSAAELEGQRTNRNPHSWLHNEVLGRIAERLEWITLPVARAAVLPGYHAGGNNSHGGHQTQERHGSDDANLRKISKGAALPAQSTQTTNSALHILAAKLPQAQLHSYSWELVVETNGLAASASSPLNSAPSLKAKLDPETTKAVKPAALVRKRLSELKERILCLVGLNKPTPPAASVASRKAAYKNEETYDLLVSNLDFHLHAHPLLLLKTWHSLLSDTGYVMFSTFGAGTLQSLRSAYRQAGWGEAAQDFADMHDVGDLLNKNGFAEPVLDSETLTLTYASPERALEDLRTLGRNLHPQRFAGLRGKGFKAKLHQLLRTQCTGPDGRIHLVFEIVYGHALKSPPRAAVAPSTHVDLSDMRRMLKQKPHTAPPAPKKVTQDNL